MKYFILGIYFLFCSAVGITQETPSVNALALPNGSYMVKTPSSYVASNLMGGVVQQYAPEALFDLSNKLWCSKEGASFPHVFIMELNEIYIIDKMVFNNQCEKVYKGIASKRVQVEFSVESPESGYSLIGDYELPENQVTSFVIERREARWIRFSVISNYGNRSFTELAEIEAYGVLKNPDIRPIDVNGKWQSNWGWVQIAQLGSSLNGYYEFNNGKIPYGGVERSKITYKWIEKKINREGWVTLFLNQDGTRLTGVWCYEDNWKEYGFWILWRNTGIPITPVNQQSELKKVPEVVPEKPAPVNQEVVESMQKELKAEGKIVLYGINFSFNSSEIQTASYAVMDQLAEVLKQNPKIKIRIEGHTDNSGSDDYNARLSSSRAEAVKKYLVEKHGIDFSRIISEGKGESRPVADNATETGKASNRRVEIHQQ